MAKHDVKYKTPMDLIAKIDEYFANPNYIMHHYKNDVYQVPEITVEAVCRYLGYHEKYIYQLTDRPVDESWPLDWQDAIDHLNSRMKSHYKMVSEHGNQTFGIYMLSCLGEKPKSDEKESDSEILAKSISNLVEKLPGA